MQNACEILRFRVGWYYRVGWSLQVVVVVVGVLGGECRVNTLHHECQGVRSSTCGHWTISHHTIVGPSSSMQRWRWKHGEVERASLIVSLY